MSCTPQLHLYDHMPENMRKTEATDMNRVALRVTSSPKDAVKTTSTNKSIWRWTLALFLNPINAPRSLRGVDAAARYTRGANQLPGVLRRYQAIHGEKKDEKEEKKKDYYESERRFGSFERYFGVPDGVDTNKIDATFKQGVLKVTLPKTPESQKQEKKISKRIS